ncbi:MAG: cell division protein SepF [Clostridia bacterium]|nr:cell division protein SepF [Clostridia bacterium]
MGIVDKFKKMWNPPEDEYEYYEDEYVEGEDGEEEVSAAESVEEAYEEEPRTRSRSYGRTSTRPQQTQRTGKVVNIAPSQLKFALFKPSTFGEETRSIADDLMQKNMVVINLESTEKDVARRIVDFLSGVAYANNGKIKRIATSTFVIIPFNVDFTGDGLLDELENNGIYF